MFVWLFFYFYSSATLGMTKKDDRNDRTTKTQSILTTYNS